MPNKTCGAEFSGEGDVQLTCELAPDHDGNHRDDVHEWGRDFSA